MEAIQGYDPKQKPLAASVLLEAGARLSQTKPLAGHKSTESLFCPFLPNPETGEWGRWCVIRRLSPVQGLTLVSKVQESVRMTDPYIGQENASEAILQRFNLPELDSEEGRVKFWTSVWTLVLGCVDSVLSFDDAVMWLSHSEVKGVPVGDAADFLQFHIASLNEEHPGLADFRGGLKTLRQIPAALQGVERAFDAGPEVLRAYLENDEEAGKFISKWGEIVGAVALESLQRKAQIYADAHAKAVVERFARDILPLFFRGQPSGAADS